MPLAWARLVALVIEVYALAGVVFALAFATVGVQRVDARAHGAGVGFRLLILPGAVLWWPLLAVRWTRTRR